MKKTSFSGKSVTELDAVSGDTKESWKVKVKINGLIVDFKLDKGTDVTVIPPSLYRSLKPHSITKQDDMIKLLMGPCNRSLTALELSLENSLVLQGLERALLGRVPAGCLKLISSWLID